MRIISRSSSRRSRGEPFEVYDISADLGTAAGPHRRGFFFAADNGIARRGALDAPARR